MLHKEPMVAETIVLKDTQNYAGLSSNPSITPS